MQGIDFVTAFGRLLRDGTLRDVYAREPLMAIERLEVCEADRPALLQLDPRQLEFQAEVLLRKRLQSVTQLIPRTIANAGQRTWSLFTQYGRAIWCDGHASELDDALQFCRYLRAISPSLVCMREFNRIQFTRTNAPFAIRFVRDVMLRNKQKWCLQVLLRTSTNTQRECLLYLAL